MITKVNRITRLAKKMTGIILNAVPPQLEPSEVIDVSQYNVIHEGKAEILTPKEDKVFYNPIQQFNRDLSIMAINSYVELRHEAWEQKQKAKEESRKDSPNDSGEKRRRLDGPGKVRICEALSATGLRAIRYGHEIANVSEIVANDLLPEAVKSIDRNVTHNKLQGTVSSNLGDAIKYMGLSGEKFHVVDLDPYGTAAPFVDSAFQAIEDGGLMLVTCTDAGVLAGSGYPEKCFSLYGGNNLGGSFVNSEANHEAGIRLILHLLSSTAAKYLKSIEPVLSLSIDFYFRVFIRVKTSPIQVKQLGSRTMIVYGCNGCGHKVLQPLGRATSNANGKGHKFQYPRVVEEMPGSHCRFCGTGYNIAGPMWQGPIHDAEFIDKVLAVTEKCDKKTYGTTERIKGMLTLARSELEVSTPFYFNLNQLCSVFKSPPISINEAARALGAGGYKVALTHAKKNCIKTDAPWENVLRLNWLWLVKSNRQYLKECEEQSKTAPLSEKVAAKVQLLQENIGYSPNLAKGSVGARILDMYKDEAVPEDAEAAFEVDNETSKQLHKLRNVKMVRYQENPTKNWGPKLRPKSS